MKCILFIRTSTVRQEIESQLKETREYAESLGYDEFVKVDGRGASAYKVNKLYLTMIERLKQTILNDPDIKAVVVWHLNRLARNDEQAANIKNFLIEHKIQLHVKEPSLTLLNPDGTVNDGAELVYNIFGTFSKQQVSELRAKSHRAKERDKKQHKYLGGRGIFGYSPKDKYMVRDDIQGPIVEEMFELYASGNYSFNTLAREINERHGIKFPKYRVAQILGNSNYYKGEIYPPIITREVYDKVQDIARNAANKPRNYKYKYFGAKLIKCPQCGQHYVADSDSYRCNNRCPHQMVSLSNMDGLLWLIASHFEGEWLKNVDSKAELRQKQAVLDAKITEADKSLTKQEKMRQRAKNAYLEGIIELDEYKERVGRLNDEARELEKKITEWRNQIQEIERLMEHRDNTFARIIHLSDTITSYDEEQMRAMVRKWIKEVEISEDKIVTVHTIAGDYKLKYTRYGNTRNRWSTLSNRPLGIVPILRDEEGVKFKKMNFNPLVIPNTLSWLSGSIII